MVAIDPDQIDKELKAMLIKDFRHKNHIPETVPIKITSLDISVRQVKDD